METSVRYLIVGGGMAADAALRAVRRRDPVGSMVLLSDEPHPPYQRPPLTKKLWSDQRMEEIWCAATFSPATMLTSRVHAIEPALHTVTTDRGLTFRYEKLLLATGGRPVQLTDLGVPEDPGVLYYRTLNDYLMLKQAMRSHDSVVLIGGGFIAAELAAALSQTGITVTMVIPEAGILGRLLPAELCQHVTDLYRQHGVIVHAGDSVVGVRQTSTGYQILLDRPGDPLEAAVVVAGLGLRPNDDLAKHAGINTQDGILVDNHMCTSTPDIYAAGDVARFPYGGSGALTRVEHEDNALKQGRIAGENMTGRQLTYDHLPFFYSDLFHLGFEAVGRLDASLESFCDWVKIGEEGVVYYLEDHRVVGVLNWNVWDGIARARELVAHRGPGNPERLRGLIRNHG